jgi:hypothetical protein
MFTKKLLFKRFSTGLLMPVALFSFANFAYAETTLSVSPTSPLSVVIAPPEMVGDLMVPSYQAHSVALNWQVQSATYDKDATYDIRYSTNPITNDASFATATQFTGAPIPASMLSMTFDIGRMEIISGLAQNTTYHFALKSKFKNSDWSSLSDIPSYVIPTGTQDTGVTLTKDLFLGKTDPQVGTLENFLAVQGLYYGPISNHFEALTKSAVVAFQQKNALPATGYVGRMTRAKIASMTTKSPK